MEKWSIMGAGSPVSFSLLMLAFALPVLVSSYQGIKSSEKALMKGFLSLLLLLSVCWVTGWTLVLLGGLM